MNKKFELTIAIENSLSAISSGYTAVSYLPAGESFNTALTHSDTITGIALPENFKAVLQEKSNSISLTVSTDPLRKAVWQSIDTTKKFTIAFFRNAVANLVKNFSDTYYNTLVICIPDYQHFTEVFPDKAYFYQSFVEGAFYGNYTFNAYKSDNTELKPLSIVFVTNDSGLFTQSAEKAKAIMHAVELTRNLQNEPGSAIYPESFAGKISETFTNLPVKVTIFDEHEILKRNMGGLYGVGKGSERAPRFVVLEYSPANATKHVSLVGKGVTFDTGGISIKPSADMGEMKGDMSGAAVVAGTLLAAVNTGLPVRLTGIIPLAENMPSSKAMRPGDILTTSSGKTIEVDNTDAEGRLILADALHYAKELQPDTIIDFATLTGACVVALGEFVAGLFTAHEALGTALFQTGLTTDERVWRMPMWDEYNELIKSSVADVKNIGGRWGGSITAAKFLEHWAGKEIPWAHIDIAGPAMPHKYNAYTDTYFTGFGVRLMMQYLERIDN